jgi:hypothetical protein
MKWASKFKLFAMGLAVATATQSISANPVLRMGGPDSGLNPNGLMPAWQGGGSIEPFQAVLANPYAAGMNDEATCGYQVAQLNALKALSLGGFGGVGEMTACELDALGGVSLALSDNAGDTMLVEAKAAEDMIAALIGLPLVGIEGFATSNTLAGAPDIDALVASILGNDGVDADEAIAELAATDGMLESSINLMGNGGGGGAFYGGANAHLGGPNTNNNTGHSSHVHGGGTISNGGGTASPSVVVPTIISTDGSAISGATTVPLPSGAWAGLGLLGTLGAAYGIRTKRAVIA